MNRKKITHSCCVGSWPAGRFGHPGAHCPDSGDCRAHCPAAGGVHFVGGVCRPANQRPQHGSAGGPVRTPGLGLRSDDGHLGHVHRSVRRCSGPGWSRDHGNADRGVDPVSVLAARLSWLRRIFTPAVSGTVIMLIAATVMPIAFASLTDIPEGTSTTGTLWAAAATLVVVVFLILRAPPVAPMGSHHRDRCRHIGISTVRPVRNTRCSVGSPYWLTQGFLARFELQCGCKVLGTPARICGGDHRGIPRNHR